MELIDSLDGEPASTVKFVLWRSDRNEGLVYWLVDYGLERAHHLAFSNRIALHLSSDN
jgi:hypothetical protein